MKNSKGTKRHGTSTSSQDSNPQSHSTCSRKRTYTRHVRDLVGRVLWMEMNDHKKAMWAPVLVIIPSAANMELKTYNHLLVKSFKDSTIHTVARKDTTEFTRYMAVKNKYKVLKSAMKKALTYLDTQELPTNWERGELLGQDSVDKEQSHKLNQQPSSQHQPSDTPVMRVTKRHQTPSGSNVSKSQPQTKRSKCSSVRKHIYTRRMRDLVGRVLCMEMNHRKKTLWVPVVVIIPSASDKELKTKNHILVKSFKDSSIHTVAHKDTMKFTRDKAVKNKDKVLNSAMKKALAYLDTQCLPSNWDRGELLGQEREDKEQSHTSEDVSTKEKDHFVAQLYNFMEERDTPITEPPAIGGCNLNLYRLYMLVHGLGGYKEVTNSMKWKMVHSKMDLPTSTTAYQVNSAYKKYLLEYEESYTTNKDLNTVKDTNSQMTIEERETERLAKVAGYSRTYYGKKKNDPMFMELKNAKDDFYNKNVRKNPRLHLSPDKYKEHLEKKKIGQRMRRQKKREELLAQEGSAKESVPPPKKRRRESVNITRMEKS